MRTIGKARAAWCVAGGTLLAVLIFATAARVAEVESLPPGPPPAGAESPRESPDQGATPEVLTRGPIHEAYAAPVATGGLKPLTVPKAPPPPVEEVPPDVKPEDESAIWIPGYWAWDDDRKDFIWVSGVWRAPPSGATWVAGYWTEVDGGWRWVPGFWTSAETTEATYYPEPPESLEQGPTSEPASPDYFWVPGCWEWRVGRYVWRPGYWAVVQPDWVWVPASYCWSPRGWVFVAGYWDYPLWRRGVLFAPVCFHRPLWRVGYVYRPAVVVDIGAVTLHLFARPICYHYYFGDYYARVYETWGFYPWFGVYRHRYYHYDPLFVYCRWYYHRHDPRWESHLRGWHRYFQEHEDLRPPRSLAQQQVLNERLRVRPDLDPRVARTVASTVTLAAPASEFRKRPDSPVRLTDLSSLTRQRVQQQARELRNVAVQRKQIEVESPSRVATPKLPATKATRPALGKAPGVKMPKVGAETRPGPAGPSVAELPKPADTSGPSQPQRVALPRLPKLSGPAASSPAGPTGSASSGPSPPAGGKTLPPAGRVRPGRLPLSTPKSPALPVRPSTVPGLPKGISAPGNMQRGPAAAPRIPKITPPSSSDVPKITPKSSGDVPAIQRRPASLRTPAVPSVRPPTVQFRSTAVPPSAPLSFRRPPAATRPGDNNASPTDSGGVGGPSGKGGRGKR